jgi:hypothetical protein
MDSMYSQTALLKSVSVSFSGYSILNDVTLLVISQYILPNDRAIFSLSGKIGYLHSGKCFYFKHRAV